MIEVFLQFSLQLLGTVSHLSGKQASIQYHPTKFTQKPVKDSSCSWDATEQTQCTDFCFMVLKFVIFCAIDSAGCASVLVHVVLFELR